MVPPRFGVEIPLICEKLAHDDQKNEEKWSTVPIVQLWAYEMNTPIKHMHAQPAMCPSTDQQTRHF